jgi:pimeloyl-ACP methyl ester carboxylesterase
MSGTNEVLLQHATDRDGTTSNTHGSYVQANELNIYYEEYGSGAPLVLIHGGCVNLNSWSQYIPAFARHFRVFAFDSRGHGRTKNCGTMSILLAEARSTIRALVFSSPFAAAVDNRA